MGVASRMIELKVQDTETFFETIKNVEARSFSERRANSIKPADSYWSVSDHISRADFAESYFQFLRRMETENTVWEGNKYTHKLKLVPYKDQEAWALMHWQLTLRTEFKEKILFKNMEKGFEWLQVSLDDALAILSQVYREELESTPEIGRLEAAEREAYLDKRVNDEFGPRRLFIREKITPQNPQAQTGE